MKKKRDCLLHGNFHKPSIVYLGTVCRSVIVICDTPQASFWINDIMRGLARAVKLAIVKLVYYVMLHRIYPTVSYILPTYYYKPKV